MTSTPKTPLVTQRLLIETAAQLGFRQSTSVGSQAFKAIHDSCQIKKTRAEVTFFKLDELNTDALTRLAETPSQDGKIVAAAMETFGIYFMTPAS